MIEGRPIPEDRVDVCKMFDSVNITLTIYTSKELGGYYFLLDIPGRLINTDITTLNCRFFDTKKKEHIPDTNYFKLNPYLLAHVNQMWCNFTLMYDPLSRLANYEYDVPPLATGSQSIKLRSN